MSALARAVPEQEDAPREDLERVPVRRRVPAGLLSADQLGVLCDVARQHGMGFVSLTTRQGIEIPGVHLRELGAVQSRLSAAGLCAGTPGARTRNVVACTGSDKCAAAFLDARGLGRALDLLFGADEFPPQLKITVAGCPNSCTAPQMADIGFVGTVEPVLERSNCDGCGTCAGSCDENALIMRGGGPGRDPQRCDFCGACVVACPKKALRPGRLGYTVYVGGTIGRRPQVGTILARFVPEQDAPDMAARIVAFVRERGQPRERLSAIIRRVGIDHLRTYVHSRPLHRIPV